MGWLFWTLSAIIFVGISTFIIYNSVDYITVFLTLLELLLSAFVTALIMILVGVGTIPKQHSPEYEILEHHQVEVVQAKVSSQIDGYHGLCYTVINKRPVYQFYEKDSNNVIRLCQIDVNGSIIIETDLDYAYVIIYDKIRYQRDLTWWDRAFFGEREMQNYLSRENPQFGAIYIPKGTLIPNKLDGLNL